MVETIRRRVDVVDASPNAARAGVHPGMSLAEARATCADLVSIEREPERDRIALEALGRWMTRFTPSVATGWPAKKDDEKDMPLPALLLLDITGCERLFGSLALIVREVRRSLARFGLPARVAVAPTPAAAWAFAWAGSTNGQIVEPHGLLAAIAPLPVEALRVREEMSAALRHLGLENISQVLALPRDALPSRFGPKLLTRLDALLGHRPDPLIPLTYQVPVEARMELDGPAEALEILWLILKELVRRVVIDLTRRGEGARQLELICRSEAINRLPPTIRTIQLSRPTRNEPRLFELLRCATERLDCRAGFVSVTLKIPLHEKVSEEQILLLEADTHSHQKDLDHLLERLTIRLGEQAITRPTPVESYLPERAWHPTPALTAPKLTPSTPSPKRRQKGSTPAYSPTDNGDIPTLQLHSSESGNLPYSLYDNHAAAHIIATNPVVIVKGKKTAAPPAFPLMSPAARPLHLLSTPAEIRVIAEPSDDREGRPAQFAYRGQVHRLAHVLGPERLAGEWWRGHLKVRDYYDALDHTGRRFWLFRVVTPKPHSSPATPDQANTIPHDSPVSPPLSVRWFLHGLFN